jgi:hypothetical protein
MVKLLHTPYASQIPELDNFSTFGPFHQLPMWRLRSFEETFDDDSNEAISVA